MTQGRAIFTVLISCFGCAPQSSSYPPAPPEPAASSEAAPAQQPAALPSEKADVRLPIRFEPVSSVSLAAEAIPHLEIQLPSSDKPVPAAKALGSQVMLKASPWSESLKLVLALDDFPPRVFDDPTKPVALGALVPENREFEPGAHRLFAAVQLPDGTTARKANETSNSPSAFVGFWVGPGSEGQIQAAMAAFAAPRVMLLSPRGTFNGEQAAGQVFLDFHVLGAQVEPGFFQVKAEVLAAGERHEALLQDAGVVKISGLPSGDHRVALGLLTPAGELSNAAYASAMRTITVNRDAPVN